MPVSPDDRPGADPMADRAVDRAAALDDLLGGFTAPGEGGALPGAVDDAASDDEAGLVETMLLLRQVAAADGATPAAAVGPPAPRTIGRYAILRLAGEGGFATVWEGFDTVLRRPVAVKVRRPEALLSETARRRFMREAEIAARLVHPHIVTLFEVGVDEGREFIAAEFCSGGSLAAWLERHPGPLPPRAAARLVRALAGAVAYAHEAGVVHRDIKPANVLLAPSAAGTEPIVGDSTHDAVAGRGLTVKLGDFGLGKLQEDLEAGDPLTQLTRTGASIGTPAWMAPEQIDRSFGAIGPATDVHALGLLLDRLLTGRSLRSGGTTAETYRQVLIDEVRPANRAARGVPADLAAVGLKCLAKKPADRYASAAALADDLDRWLDGEPTVARPMAPAARALRWVGRRPVVATLAAAALIASLVAAWAGVGRMREARQAAARADEIRRQQAVAELRRGFEALRAGNVTRALAQLETTRELDPGLAGSLAGRWLERRTHGERAILMKPDATAEPGERPRDLYAVTIAPDGLAAAVAAADGTVRLLRGLAGTPTIHSVHAHDEVNDVAFSCDAKRLVSAGQDGRLRWWDVTAAGLVAAGANDPGAGPLFAAAFMPDGSGIACGGADRVVRLVRLDEPDRAVELFRFDEPAGKSPDIESLVVVGDGTIVAACGDLIVLIDATTGRLIREFERPFADHHNAVLGSLAVSPDGERLIACGTNATAVMWDISTGKIVTSLPIHPTWVQGCCFVGDGDRVATACRDGGIRVFDARSGKALTKLVGHVGRVWSINCEPAGTLLSCGADGTVRRWDPRDDLQTAGLRALPAEGHEILRVAEAPASAAAAGGELIVANPPLGVRRVDIAAGSSRGVSGEGRSMPTEIAVDRARRRLAVACQSQGPITVFDLADVSTPGPADRSAGIPIELPADFDPSFGLAGWTDRGELIVCSPYGKLFVLPPDFSRATPIDVPLEEPVNQLAVAPAAPPRVAVSGKRAAIIPLPDGAAATTRKPTLLPIGEDSSAVAWSPDANLVAFGTRTGRILLFDTVTGAARGQLVPHQRDMVAVVFSNDGRLLVSADLESVRITEVPTLTTLDEIRPGWLVKALQLTADAGCVVFGGHADGPFGPDTARLAVMEFGRP